MQPNSISNLLCRAFVIKPSVRRLVASQVTQIRSYSDNASPINNLGLNPFFITGLTDAEGTFVTIIKRSNSTRLG